MRGNWWAAAALVLVLLGQVILVESLRNPYMTGYDNSRQLHTENQVEPLPIVDSQHPFGSPDNGFEFAPYRALSSSEEPTTGVLDPASVEQSGYASSGNISTRTDTMNNLAYDLPLDDVHSWVASEAEVSVWNLEKIYAINGSFDEGIPGSNLNPNGTVAYYPLGWSANSTTINTGQVQLASYESTGRSYVVAENQGEKTGQGIFTHYEGTSILWTQSVDNAPYTEDFILNFNYFYLRGPLDKKPVLPTPLSGNCSITVFADGNPVWNMSLITLDRRGVWQSSGAIPINIPEIPSAFNFEIGLVIDGELILAYNKDYDNDTVDDGYGNAAYITVFFDDVSFVRATPPTPSQVDLEFTRGAESVAVTGASGSGSAVITNESYWQTNPVSVVLSSNTSVSFDYKTRLLSHRFTNSNSEIDISHEGVAYTAQFGISPDLTLFTYIGFLGDYEDPSLRVEYPIDWENATVLDPFLSDVTSQCSLGSGFFEVPGHLLDRLGWWTFTLQSPNYAISLTPQIDDGGWLNETLYRSSNKTRALIEIGTPLTTPTIFDSVNVFWILPNGTFWFDAILDGGVDGVISSSPLVLGATNTSAGEWSVEVSWTNGTEVAYDSAVFEVHHAAKLTPLETHIVTESGSTVMNFVFYQDAENNESLMDPSAATILANWSGSTKEFHPNDIHLYWEPATPFDTSLVGPGNSLVLVQANRPFFDNASCIFTIEVTYTDNNLIIYDLAADVGLFDIYVCKFYFEDRYGNYLEGALIDDVDVSGPTDGLIVNWGSFIDLGSGNYSISFTSQQSGTYQVTITAEADFYESAHETLLLYVGEIATGLEILNGTAGLVPYGLNFRLVVRYTNSTDHGIENANITLASVSPEGGVIANASIDEGEGFYSLVLAPQEVDDFTILVRANITNYQTQIERFTLSVAPIATDLHTASGDSSASVVFGTLYEIELYYVNTPEDFNISSASIQVDFTSVEELNWTVVPSGEGYILRIEADELGLWELTITAQKALHQTGSIQFSLFVTENPTSLSESLIPSSVYIGDISSYVFRYSVDDGPGIVDANVSFSGFESDWVNFTQIGDGNYNITIESNQIGMFSLKIKFSKHGYQPFEQPVTFQVDRIPLEIEMATPTWVVDSDFTFSLTLTDAAGRPVSDAFVSYTITQGGINLHTGVMTEDSDSKGTYIATMSESPVQWTGNQLYSLEVSISKENHLGEKYQVNIIEYMPPGYEVQVFIQAVVPQLAVVIFALVSLVIGRRMYRADKRKKALAILAVKRRFEDIRGILGIIVIHKTSGLGIYSKILKGGFDEDMMSAFITAITHFRSEFEMEELHWEFNVVPISDIISIVPTRNLLCAFIVGSRPTMTLEDRMVGFARSVGAMFDETMEAPPQEVIDDATQGLFDYLFDDIMDGALLRQYRIKKDAPYPRSQKCLQTYLEAYPPEDGFGLDTLADGMAMCGIQEGNVYRQIIDAIENGILESINPEENYPGFQKDDDETGDSEPADL